ncbi:hypothetical protein FGO68_gene1329 [Halteria grandinella]|uniref:CCHC-type domain-containing protein n=1 Tax=Halteria grandinella TaxID=5974 RepID=A0A8J8NJ89_HALGN|nr:hypothetical protein FGO68_gene1329 [Halteria grandinella]
MERKNCESSDDEDCCPRCDLPGHDVKDCPQPLGLTTIQIKKPAMLICTFCKKEGHESDKCLMAQLRQSKEDAQLRQTADSCHRCGEKGHFYAKCPRRDEAISVDLRDEKVRCFQCGQLGHERAHCVKKQVDVRVSKKQREAVVSSDKAAKEKLPAYEDMRIKKANPHQNVECKFCKKMGHYANHCLERAARDKERMVGAKRGFDGGAGDGSKRFRSE